MDVAWSSPLSPQEKLLITSTELWKEYLTVSLRSCRSELEKQTNDQLRENRRAMDQRARRAFEDEHKGPSKFAGKRVEHRTQEELKWRVPHGLQWVEKHEDRRDAVWATRLAQLQKVCPNVSIQHTTGEACVGVMQAGKQSEEEVRKRIADAGKRWRHRAVVQHKLELAKAIGSIATRWKLIPGDNTRLEDLLDTAVLEVLQWPRSVRMHARVGSMGLRGSQEYRWVTTGPGAQQEMEEWLQCLDVDTGTLCVSPFQLQWNQCQLVLSHGGLRWKAEVSGREVHEGGQAEETAPTQPECGTGESSEHGRTSGGNRKQTRIVPSTVTAGAPSGDRLVRIVTLTTPSLAMVDTLLTESQRWDSAILLDRQILVDEGPWRGTDMTIAWELYFQAQGLAPAARCGQQGCTLKQPHVIVAKADESGHHEQPRRQLTGFCEDCWRHTHLRHGREDVADMSFLFNAGVFKKKTRIDPRARLKGRVTDNEFRSFVDSCLKANKSPGPDGYTNECVKTMSHAELEVLRAWANEILALEGARVMTVEEMNGTISLLHKGGTTDDKPQDWRPVVLLNCTNQLVMHILNARLRSIVEKAGILEPGQSGGRQGRSTDINLAKLEWVTQEAVAQGRRVYRVDVDFCNAFNAMSQAALWAVMRAYGIPDVDLLVSLYEHSTVRMAPNDPQCATIAFDTGVAQGSALSPLLFLVFMNALLGLITDRGRRLRVSHGLKCGVQVRKRGKPQDTEQVEHVGQFNLIGFVDDLSLFTQTLGGAQALLEAIQEFELWSGLKVNRKKTCAMIIERQGPSQCQTDETLTYMGQKVALLAPSVACRYLGVWGTPTGDMSATKTRIFKKTEEARDLLKRHPLTPEQAIDLFTSIGVGAFRYSAALVPWTEKELERLEAVWIQAYKWAWGLPRSTASDVFVLPAGMEYLRPVGVMAQELCRHLQRCLKHDDVAKQLTLRDLHLACEQWACDSLRELTEEMEMWKWDDALGNKWARVAMCSQRLNIPINMPEGIKEERRGTSWARATRELRRLRHRIEAVGGSKDQWEAGVWHMDKEQWNLLWTGEQAFWKAVPHLMAAGHRTAEALTEPRKLDTGRPYKIPQLMAAQEGERTQLMRILVSRGIGGIDERTRWLTQRWFDMVDWRAMHGSWRAR
jgi:hypothetical protein